MAKIVGVHGVGHQFNGANTLRAEWLPALKDGLALADRQLASDEDFACAFYGDVFRPAGKSGTPPYDASDVVDEWEIQMLEELWKEAARVDAAVTSPERRDLKGTPTLVQGALDALSRSRYFAAILEPALIFDLKQVRMYMNDSAVKRECQARLARAVGPDTTVLVAHSLGSVVAYEALCANPNWRVRTFVSLGSPLGIANLIFDKLVPSPTNGFGRWPAGVERWFNITAQDDVVALVKNLGSRFGARIVNLSVGNGAHAHDARHYLTTEESGNAVASGL